jgi:hypothetical protein
VLVDFLRANAEVFAWSPSDMPNIPRDVAEHSLDIRAGARPVKQTLRHFGEEKLKGKCALGPFLSILVIECQHKCLSVNLCQLMDKVQIKSEGMFLRLSTLFWRLMYCV